MSSNAISKWHDLVRTRDARGLGELLARDVAFFSPIVHTPQIGKDLTIMYLSAAIQVFGNDSFRYVREVIDDTDAVLEFETEIDGIQINGVDMIRWNEAGEITEFKVMIRPLKAIDIVRQKMGAILERG